MRLTTVSEAGISKTMSQPVRPLSSSLYTVSSRYFHCFISVTPARKKYLFLSWILFSFFQICKGVYIYTGSSFAMSGLDTVPQNLYHLHRSEQSHLSRWYWATSMLFTNDPSLVDKKRRFGNRHWMYLCSIWTIPETKSVSSLFSGRVFRRGSRFILERYRRLQ